MPIFFLLKFILFKEISASSAMISQPFPVSLVPPFLRVVIKSSEVLRTKKAALPI